MTVSQLSHSHNIGLDKVIRFFHLVHRDDDNDDDDDILVDDVLALLLVVVTENLWLKSVSSVDPYVLRSVDIVHSSGAISPMTLQG